MSRQESQFTGCTIDCEQETNFTGFLVAAVFAEGAALAARNLFGNDIQKNREGLEALWNQWNEEAARVWLHIKEHLA